MSGGCEILVTPGPLTAVGRGLKETPNPLCGAPESLVNVTVRVTGEKIVPVGDDMVAATSTSQGLQWALRRLARGLWLEGALELEALDTA
jgi:hypothetical protein